MLMVIVLLPGCFLTKNSKVHKKESVHDTATEVDIPVAQSTIKDFFDDAELDELMLEDRSLNMLLEEDSSQYAWIDETPKSEYGFKKVYFDYDQAVIKPSEKEAVNHNIAQMKSLIVQEDNDGKRYEFIINGNSDSIFGQGHDMYNRLLSEQRANALKARAVAAGLPADRIRIIGRGSDLPEIVNGKPVAGTVEQQVLNRRDEIQVIIS